MSYLHTQEPAMTVVPGKGCDASSKISLKRSKKSTNGGIKAGVVSSEIQQNDGTSIEHLLATLIPNLHNIAVEDDSGNKDSDLFKLLGDTLVGDAQNIFQDCLKQGNWDDTMKSQAGAFNRFLAAYLKKYTNSTNMKDTMFRYLEHGAKKPYDQSPGDFLRRFNLLYQSSQFFEGKKQLPSDDELKDWYMSCYPKTHVLQYAKSKEYDDQDIEEITQYMQMLYQEECNNGSIAKWKHQREKGGKKRNRDDDDSRSRRSGKSSRDSRRREKRYGDRRFDNSSSHSGGGLRYNDPCPNHPKHDHVWGQCRLNPRNKEKEDSSSKRRKKDHDHKAHSHYQDDDESSDDDSFATASSGDSASDSHDSYSYKSEASEEMPRRKKSPKKSKKKKSSRSKEQEQLRLWDMDVFDLWREA